MSVALYIPERVSCFSGDWLIEHERSYIHIYPTGWAVSQVTDWLNNESSYIYTWEGELFLRWLTDWLDDELSVAEGWFALVLVIQRSLALKKGIASIIIFIFFNCGIPIGRVSFKGVVPPPFLTKKKELPSTFMYLIKNLFNLCRGVCLILDAYFWIFFQWCRK